MQRAKDITEVLKNVVQILAIVIAGIWSYYLFGRKEAPSLEPLADVSSSLVWENINNENTCRAIYKVVFQNTGNSSFDITKIHLRGWRFNKMPDTTKEITFLDIDEIQNSSEKIFDKVYEAKKDANGKQVLIPFINHYPPDAAYNHSFDWEVKNTNDKWICFKIEFFSDGDNNQPGWMTTSWDRICNIHN